MNEENDYKAQAGYYNMLQGLTNNLGYGLQNSVAYDEESLGEMLIRLKDAEIKMLVRKLSILRVICLIQSFFCFLVLMELIK